MQVMHPMEICVWCYTWCTVLHPQNIHIYIHTPPVPLSLCLSKQQKYVSQCYSTEYAIPLFSNYCFVPLGFLPGKIQVALLGKASCDSHATQPTHCILSILGFP